MVKTCCVKNCDIGLERNITCFRFPNSRLIKRQWIDAIGLTNKLTANSLICIRHFQEDDYDIVRGRPRLKAKVIPSVFSEPGRRSSSPIIIESHKSPSTKSNKDSADSIPRDSINLIEDGTNLKNQDSVVINNEKENAVVRDSKGQPNEENAVIEVVKDSNNQSNVEHPVINDKKDHTNENNAVILDKKDETNKFNAAIKNKTDGRNKDAEGGHEQRHVRSYIKKDKPNGVLSTSARRGDSQELLIESTPQPQHSSTADDLNKDIEDIIVHYQIKQTRPVHSIEVIENNVEEEPQRIEENGIKDGNAGSSEEEAKETNPVFIEVAVPGKGDRAGSPRDCLMVLESVQVELDPQTFLTEEGEHPDADCHETVDLDDDIDDAVDDKRQDPISLLTSSDDDEVIIQEPHIDTVEVSDETDEDDMPLVKLLKKQKKKKKERKIKLWEPYEYFCVDCQYSTTNRAQYQDHAATHSTILQVCEICDYTTASKGQFYRHKKKHKDDKKYKCHLCDYKARHNMSLIYHLKSHRALSNSKKGFKCDKCGFKSDVKSVVLKHVKLCSTNVEKFSCNQCVYETKKASNLKRHKARRHNEVSKEADEVEEVEEVELVEEVV